MNLKTISLAIGSFLYGCAIWYCDTFFVLLAFVGVVCCGLAGSFFAAVLMYSAKDSRAARQLAARIFKGTAVMVVIAGVALGLNHLAQDYAVNVAKAYPDKIAPLLEDYRKAHGFYPASLDEVPAKPKIPRLLRGGHGYHSDGNTYMFSFGEPGSFFDAWTYDNKSRRWEFSS